MGDRRVEYCCYLTLVVLSGIVLISTGAHVVLHHLTARDYVSAHCSTVGVKDHGRTPCTYEEFLPISQGDELITVLANSYFHCVQIDVSYEDHEGLRRNGTIYENVFMVSDDLKQCSCKTCGESELKSNSKVQEFMSKWQGVRAPRTSPCFYNPTNQRQVIDRNPFTCDEAIHAVLWSAAIFVLSLTVLFVRRFTIFEKLE